MGAQSTKYNHEGSIGIGLQKYSYLEGEDVNGFIYISLQTVVPPSELYLTFTGKEKTHWTETRTETHYENGRTHSRSTTHHYSGKKVICSFQRLIWTFPDTIQPGGIQIPFTFKLPFKIPGTFAYCKGNNSASIIYKLHAKIINKENRNYKGEIPIRIIQPLYQNVQSIRLEKKARLRTWCCVNQGDLLLNVRHQQDSYTPSQVARFVVNANNSNSKLNITSLRGKLTYLIRLRSDNGHSNTFFGHVIETKANVKIAAGDSLLANTDVEMALDLPLARELLDNMYTTRGNLIECTYNIDVGADLDGTCMCCGDAPSIATPMIIVPDVVFLPPVPLTPPPNWNPVELQHAYVTYEGVPGAPEENGNL
jgi:Arrestin (or S-antigen), N-terminal domain